MSKTCAMLDGSVKTLVEKVKTFAFNDCRNNEDRCKEIDDTVNKFIKQVNDSNGTIHSINCNSMLENGYFHHNFIIHYSEWVSKEEPKTKKTKKKGGA